ncbi:hypothetical protein BC937DRAFT_87922 [Endogone sp. FLAS-F59071]|nr:hypothetical protein BC937DRAFT_87922 [Endogone sp. FLAS-F59071]|eukprot:RUS19154.1 hypothetical protein BC937DRAFT_87922 [Endogone sp. FLAS-F59071]
MHSHLRTFAPFTLPCQSACARNQITILKEIHSGRMLVRRQAAVLSSVFSMLMVLVTLCTTQSLPNQAIKKSTLIKRSSEISQRRPTFILSSTVMTPVASLSQSESALVSILTAPSASPIVTTIPSLSSSSNFTSIVMVPLPGGNEITPQDLYHNMKVLWAFGFTIMQLHLLGTLYVMLRTYIRWRRAGLSSMAHRLPFYLSCLDFFLYFLYNGNGLPVITQGHTLEETACKFVSGSIFYTVCVNMMLAGTTSVVTYLRVCRQIYFDLGKYDWRFLAFCVCIPLAATCIAIPSFGSDTYWCYANRKSKVIAVINLLLIFSVLVVACICYFCVITAVSRSKAQAMGVTEVPRKLTSVENKAIKKIISYVMYALKFQELPTQNIAQSLLTPFPCLSRVFVLNWSPSVPYVIGQVVDWAPFNLYVVTMLANCWGGILNALQYMLNEGLWDSTPMALLQKHSSDSAPEPLKKPKSLVMRYVPTYESSELNDYSSTFSPDTSNNSLSKSGAHGVPRWQPSLDWECTLEETMTDGVSDHSTPIVTL